MDAAELRHEMDAVLACHEAGELDAALTRCEALVTATTDPGDDPVVRETAFAARFERALLLTELGDLEGAAEAYGVAALTPFDPTEPDQRHESAMALLNRGICLDAVGEPEAAIAAYDDLVVRFGQADDVVTRDQVVRARVNRAAALLGLERWHEAALDAGALATELSAHDALDAEQLVMALRIRALALGELEGPTAALTVLARLDDVVDEDPAVRVQMVQARQEQAGHLTAVGVSQRALEVLETLRTRYRDDPDPVVTEALAQLP